MNTHARHKISLDQITDNRETRKSLREVLARGASLRAEIKDLEERRRSNDKALAKILSILDVDLESSTLVGEVAPGLYAKVRMDSRKTGGRLDEKLLLQEGVPAVIIARCRTPEGRSKPFLVVSVDEKP